MRRSEVISRVGLGEQRTARLLANPAWDELTPMLGPYSKAIAAAVSYIGPTADTLLRLDVGSSIVCDASTKSVRAGVTDPHTLLRWAQRGVAIYTLTNLHAKMILAESVSSAHSAFLTVGSANLSAASSDRLHEAVLVTDAHDALAEAREAIVGWKSSARGLGLNELKELCAIYRADRADSSEDDGTDEPDDVTPGGDDAGAVEWGRPTRIWLVPVGSRDNPSGEAVHIADELAEKLQTEDLDEAVAGDFVVDYFWVDDDPDPDYEPAWTYPEGNHAIVIQGTRSGAVLKTSTLSEPGKFIHRWTDPESSPSRTYYYLHRQLSDEEHTSEELTAVFAELGMKRSYAIGYLRNHIIDALVGIWADIRYTD